MLLLKGARSPTRRRTRGDADILVAGGRIRAGRTGRDPAPGLVRRRRGRSGLLAVPGLHRRPRAHHGRRRRRRLRDAHAGAAAVRRHPRRRHHRRRMPGHRRHHAQRREPAGQGPRPGRGGHHRPSSTRATTPSRSRTLTGSIERDLLLIDKVIGAGEIAISDHRSTQPTFDEFARLAAEARRGGILSGKAGVVNVHMGDGKRGLSLLRRIVAETEIPASPVPADAHQPQPVALRRGDRLREGRRVRRFHDLDRARVPRRRRGEVQRRAAADAGRPVWTSPRSRSRPTGRAACRCSTRLGRAAVASTWGG